ncbi:MAG: M23 family metallopeptidase [Armatimonadetes bacterium]|nr:M23 family metallopeptidase [Armatimonadota bacterium]
MLGVRGSTWPGGALFVSVDVSKGWTGTWNWAGRTGAMTPAPYGLRAGLAVPLDASAGGTATLKLVLKDEAGEKRELSRKIQVGQKWRPVQHLSMSSSNEAKYTDPQADREEEIVLAALRDLRPGPLWKGDFGEPSGASRSSPFGVRRVRNGRTAGFHRGLDYAGGYGEAIRAPADGVVSLARKGYVLLGNCVILNHGEGLTSLYIHLSEVLVKDGEKVKAGQVIGRIGNSGASTGPHLHYATYFHGEPIDPDLLLNLPAEWAPDAQN